MSGVTLLRVKPGVTWTQLYIYIYIYIYCTDWVWALLLLDVWTQAQLAQYNKFIENEFKN